MVDLESYKLWQVVLGVVGLVLLYYAGTRGVIVLTRRWVGLWHRRAVISLSLAVLFAPSLAGVGHAGVLPAPAWLVATQYANEGIGAGVWKWGLLPIIATWGAFFVLATVGAVLSKNNNKKVDTHGENP